MHYKFALSRLVRLIQYAFPACPIGPRLIFAIARSLRQSGYAFAIGKQKRLFNCSGPTNSYNLMVHRNSLSVNIFLSKFSLILMKVRN